MILLDTNVISEMMRPTPDPAVLAFIQRIAHDSTFTSAVCEAEVRYGLARLPVGARRTALVQRADILFNTILRDQVLPFDSDSAAHYGDIRAARALSGAPIGAADAMIAATARARGATLATRNTRDFEATGTLLFNPWDPAQHA